MKSYWKDINLFIKVCFISVPQKKKKKNFKKSVSYLQCRSMTLSYEWYMALSVCHMFFFFNHLSLSYISLPVPIKSGHGHRPSLMRRLEKIVWLFLKHVDDETRVHPKTEVQKSAIKHEDQHFFFTLKVKK